MIFSHRLQIVNVQSIGITADYEMVALFTCVVLIAAGFLVLSLDQFRNSPVFV